MALIVNACELKEKLKMTLGYKPYQLNLSQQEVFEIIDSLVYEIEKPEFNDTLKALKTYEAIIKWYQDSDNPKQKELLEMQAARDEIAKAIENYDRC